MMNLQSIKNDRINYDFKDHIATYNEFENNDIKIESLKFQIPSSSCFYLIFTLIDGRVLNINGDLGSFSFLMSSRTGFVGIALSCDNYIASKCQACENGLKPREFNSVLAQQAVIESLEENENNEEIIMKAEELFDYTIENENDFYNILSENQDVFGEEFYEYSSYGNQFTHRYLLIRAGLLAACEKMGWVGTCHGCHRPEAESLMTGDLCERCY